MRAASRAILLTGLLAALQGCVSTQPVDVGDGAGRGLAALNERASTRRVRLFLADGRAPTVRALRVERDSTSWVTGGRLEAVATADVLRVQFASRGRGLLEGVGLGALGGVAGGAVVGFATYTRPDILAGSRGEAAVFGALVFGYLGVPVGALVGVATAHRDVYELREPTAE